MAEAQKMLSLLGYDLVMDGVFGAKTQRSVKAFQKKAGLTNNGIIDDDTYSALKLAQTRKANEMSGSRSSVSYPFEVITTSRLAPEQYIKQVIEKKQIFLHYTASGPSAKGVIDYWNSNTPQIATAYVIDGDGGRIYECFNPDYWSYHLGVKGTKGALDKISIGIETCAYGPLREKNGKFYAWPNDYGTVTIPAEKVFTLQRDFRGFTHFEKFDDDQIISLEKLLEFLIKKYNIQVQESFDHTWFDFDEEVINSRVPGIWSHTTVRHDKFDLYPDNRIIEMLNRLAQKYSNNG